MMDALRDGINLRAYGQRDPLVEYQHEAYGMFRDMIASIKVESLAMLLRIRPHEGPPGGGAPTPSGPPPSPIFDVTKAKLIHEETSTRLADRFAPQSPEGPADGSAPPANPRSLSGMMPPGPPSAAPQRAAGPKIGRNDPCHCGSGLKFKKCHGK